MAFQYSTTVDDEISFDVCANNDVIINQQPPNRPLEESIVMDRQTAIDLARKLLEELGD